MPINDYFNNSKNSPIVLFQLDLLESNTQWVNIGSGIWEVNFDNLYSFVDSTLLDGFTIQAFGDIGSVLVDSEYYLKLESVLLVSETINTFYYDAVTKTLWVHFVDNDDPILHRTKLGVSFGYSYDTIAPVDSFNKYEGRILSISNFSRSRDPLFFGKLSYPTGTVTLANGDGFFDTFANDNNLYGNQGRILLGFPELTIGEYETIFTGVIDKVTISETNTIFTLKDLRAQLTKEIQCNYTNINALKAIEDILSENYGYNFTSAYYDTTSWSEAKLLAPNITLDYTNTEKVINIIEFICTSVFGFFDITPSGKFTFRYVDVGQVGEYLVNKNDILNEIKIEYNPAEVVSSVNIGYDKDWANNSFTYYENDTRELDIFDRYQVYNVKKIDTALISLSDAQALSETILDYVEIIRGIVSLQLPIKYWDTNVGAMINAEIDRINTIMLGTKRCEVIGIDLNFNSYYMTLKLRIYQNIIPDFRITTEGDYRMTTDGSYRFIE